MKFTIQREALLKPLQMMSSVVEKRHTMPILANILMTVNYPQLVLTATDLEVELVGFATLTDDPAASSANQTVAMTVSARKLLDICRSLPEGALLQFSLEGHQVLIRAGKSRFVLTTLPANEFPSIKEGDQAPLFSTTFLLSEAEFKRLLSNTHFAMGQQDVRHYLNGILLDISKGVMKCVATDGHRLAYATYADNALQEASAKVILPRKSVIELMRLLETDKAEPARVSIGDNHFRLATTSYIFTSKLINAQYPDYEKLIPRQVANSIVTGRDTLKQALARASILSNEKFRGIRLLLEKGMMRIMANNPEQEEAEELVHLDYEGNSVEFGFNVAYLLDVVSTLLSETVRWSFNDPDGGVIIEAPGQQDSLFVVMPMRL